MSGQTELVRTGWATSHPLLMEYYDSEWGLPIRDERGVFERLVLESFQSGLSWLTVLKKRDAFRKAFSDFVPDVVAEFGENDVERLLEDAAIIRNSRKVKAAIQNARATIALRESSTGHLGEFVWEFMPETSPVFTAADDPPSFSPESVRLASELKTRGFTFVGPTTAYALMGAIGVVDLHTVDSYRRGCSGLWNRDGTRAVG